MRSLVVDANVAIKWLNPAEPLADAEESGSEFWTADQKLYNAVKDRLPFVKWLGDYEEETSTSKT